MPAMPRPMSRTACLTLLLCLAPLAACGPAADREAPRLATAAAATNTALAQGRGDTPAAAPTGGEAAPAGTPTGGGCCLRPSAVAATPPGPGSALPLEVRDTLYSTAAGYALLLVHNPNPDRGVHRSPYRAALRGADGRLLAVSEQGLPGSLDQTIFLLPPGETIVLEPRFAPAPLAPAAVELIGPPAAQFQSWPAGGPLAEVALARIAPGRLALASGQVRNLTGEEANLIVSLALFDAAGRLVNGAEDVVEAVPAGGAKAFQTPLLTDVVAGRVEVRAWPAHLAGLRDYTGAQAPPSAAGLSMEAAPAGARHRAAPPRPPREPRRPPRRVAGPPARLPPPACPLGVALPPSRPRGKVTRRGAWWTVSAPMPPGNRRTNRRLIGRPAWGWGA